MTAIVKTIFFTLSLMISIANVSAIDLNPIHWIHHILHPTKSKSDHIDSLKLLDTDGIVKFYGYPVEKHVVTTDDGFILDLFRMPQQTGPSRGTLLLAHGILDSSDTWVLNREDQSLAFLAHNQGYDVWLMNSRGNKYGVKHTTLSSNDNAFWKFSFDEMARYDIPAVVHYILDHTEFPTMSYGCHSQGCTQMVAAVTRYHSFLNEAIDHMYGLAPVIYAYYSKSPLLDLLSKYDVDQILPIIGMREFLPDYNFFKKLLPLVCDLPLVNVCGSVMHLMIGYNSKNFDFDREPLYFTHFVNFDFDREPLSFTHFPSGTSSHNMIHWAQHFRFNQFDLFEFSDKQKTLEYYGTDTTPKYNLSLFNITSDFYLGEKDELTSPKDISKLQSQIENVDYHWIPNFSHIDFVWGKTCRENVYQNVLEKMNSVHMTSTNDYDETTYKALDMDTNAHPNNSHFMAYVAVVAVAVAVTGAAVCGVVYKRRRGYEQLV
eukprot:Awhi_evm1s4801